LAVAFPVSWRASVCSAGADDLTNTDDEMKVAMRQIAGAFSQLEKSRLVRKLREARERKRTETGKCEGRKSYAQVRPEVVALAKELRSGGMSLRKISAELATRGHLTGGGKPYVASAVRAMLA
jgi:DNA invertase Pin-like site-specific DNA recombinase